MAKKIQSQAIQQYPPAYLRLADMRTRYRVSGSTIWNWAADESTGFPKPIRLGPNTTVWRIADLLQWEQKQAVKSGAACWNVSNHSKPPCYQNQYPTQGCKPSTKTSNG